MYPFVIHPPRISTVLYFKGIKSDFTANRKAAFQEFICRESTQNLKIIRSLLRLYKELLYYLHFCRRHQQRHVNNRAVTFCF